MKLSMLDQSPISTNQTAHDALEASKALAQLGDSLGYNRYWIAEHHALDGYACSAPEVMLGYIGGHTKNIRIGSGAVLLPYYKPYKVAETYHLLSTLFENRVDIGIGRAPGGPAEASEALSDNYLQNVYKMSDLVSELAHYVDKDKEGLQAFPLPSVEPELWMLGTSEKSAIFAAETGMSYCFGQFMSDTPSGEILEQYRRTFQPRKKGQRPYAILTLSVICAETKEEAEDIALSAIVWEMQKERREGGEGVPSISEAKKYRARVGDEASFERIKNNIIIGNPTDVKKRLEEIQTNTGADEIMIVTITYSEKDKQQSYQLLAEACIQ